MVWTHQLLVKLRCAALRWTWTSCVIMTNQTLFTFNGLVARYYMGRKIKRHDHRAAVHRTTLEAISVYRIADSTAEVFWWDDCAEAIGARSQLYANTTGEHDDSWQSKRSQPVHKVFKFILNMDEQATKRFRQESYIRAFDGCLWHKTPMKDVVDCDKPRLAVKQAYPGISEWGNPIRFISYQL